MIGLDAINSLAWINGKSTLICYGVKYANKSEIKSSSKSTR